MELKRDDLDDVLIWECKMPTNTSVFKDRRMLLQRAQELVAEERNFLQKWTLELRNRERLLK